MDVTLALELAAWTAVSVTRLPTAKSEALCNLAMRIVRILCSSCNA